MTKFAWHGDEIIIIGKSPGDALREALKHRIGPDEALVEVDREELKAWLEANPKPQK